MRDFLTIWGGVLIATVPIAYGAYRIGRAFGIDEHKARTLVDHPCSKCGMPTGWTWFGRPLCTTCRKREIEAS